MVSLIQGHTFLMGLAQCLAHSVSCMNPCLVCGSPPEGEKPFLPKTRQARRCQPGCGVERTVKNKGLGTGTCVACRRSSMAADSAWVLLLRGRGVYKRMTGIWWSAETGLYLSCLCSYLLCTQAWHLPVSPSLESMQRGLRIFHHKKRKLFPLKITSNTLNYFQEKIIG